MRVQEKDIDPMMQNSKEFLPIMELVMDVFNLITISGAALIGNTIALEGKLNVLKDTIFYERINQSTKDNINILATTAKEKNNKKFKQLVQLYHSQAAQKYISRKFDNTKIEVNKPISYLSN